MIVCKSLRRDTPAGRVPLPGGDAFLVVIRARRARRRFVPAPTRLGSYTRRGGNLSTVSPAERQTADESDRRRPERTRAGRVQVAAPNQINRIPHDVRFAHNRTGSAARAALEQSCPRAGRARCDRAPNQSARFRRKRYKINHLVAGRLARRSRPARNKHPIDCKQRRGVYARAARLFVVSQIETSGSGLRPKRAPN